MTRLENAVRELAALAPPESRVRVRIALWELVHALRDEIAAARLEAHPGPPASGR